MVFPLLNVGDREKGGRDPNERPDNQNHPEETLDSAANSLTSAKRTHVEETQLSVIKNKGREQYRRYWITRLVITSELAHSLMYLPQRGTAKHLLPFRNVGVITSQVTG